MPKPVAPAVLPKRRKFRAATLSPAIEALENRLLLTRLLGLADLVGSFRLSKQAISQHLRILRTSGLVQQRRIGRSRVYQIQPSRLREVYQWAEPYKPLWTGKRATR